MRAPLQMHMVLLATVASSLTFPPSAVKAQSSYAAAVQQPETLTGRLKFLYMFRENNGGNRLLRNTDTNATLLRPGDFDFDFEPGVDTSIVYHTASGVGIEGRFVWFDDWTASAAIPNPGQIDITTNPFTGPFGADFTGHYSSELQTAEINLRFPGRPNDITWIAGFRYVELNEDLGLYGRGPGSTPSNTTFATRNDLYGFQVGVDANLYRRDRFRLDGFAKFGVYANNTEAQSRITLGAFGQLNRETDDEVVGAFLTEFGIEAGYQLTNHITLLAGYQGMLLEGVALASDQVGRTRGNLGFPGAATNFPMHASNQVFYHGISTSVEVTW